MSNESDFLSKSDVRGKRRTNNKTYHRTEKSKFDDSNKEVKGTRHGHSRLQSEDGGFMDLDFEDEPYGDLIDLKMIK